MFFKFQWLIEQMYLTVEEFSNFEFLDHILVKYNMGVKLSPELLVL